MPTLQLAKPYCGRLFCLFSQFDNTCPAPALLKSVILGVSTREPSLALAVKSGCVSHGPSSTRPSPLSHCTSLFIIRSHLCYPIPIVCCAEYSFCLEFLRVKFQGLPMAHKKRVDLGAKQYLRDASRRWGTRSPQLPPTEIL